MGTSNFHVVNAKNTYAVLMNYEVPIYDENENETDETECVSPDAYECEDFINELKSSILEKIKGTDIKHYGKIKKTNSLRDHPVTDLFMLYKRKTFSYIEIDVEINCLIRTAYYEGASLDWFVTYTIDYNTQDELDFKDQFENNDYLNAGMQKIQCNLAEKWAEKTKEELIDFVEKFYTENSTPLTVTARFSNGETIYSKI